MTARKTAQYQTFVSEARPEYMGTPIMPPVWKLQLVRDPNSSVSTRTQVCCPADVATVLMSYISNEAQEHFVVVALDAKNHILGVNTVYVGNVSAILLRAAEVFRPAILLNAAAIIVSHNHPSGDPAPSPEDVRSTETLVEAGKLLDLPVLDHIIVGENTWVSLKERGLGFGRE